MSKNLVLLYAPFKIFSPNKSDIYFNPISIKDSKNILITLMNENYNLLNQNKKWNTSVSIFEEDVEYLPSLYNRLSTTIHRRVISESMKETSELVSTLIPKTYNKILLLLSNCILNSSQAIIDIFDMMAVDTERLIIGSTLTGKFAFIGFNYPKIELFANFNKNDFDFDYLLRKSMVENAEVITINEQRICLSFEDVVNLYSSF